MEEKKYTVGGKIFIQKKLVLGQWRQLGKFMQTVAIPAELDARTLIIELGENIFPALAIVLTEEGKSPKDKDIEKLADEIEFGITPEDAIRVINDFFSLNPIPSLLSAIGTMTETLKAKMTEIGSKNAATSSAEETSANGNGSSGTLQPSKPEAGLSAS